MGRVEPATAIAPIAKDWAELRAAEIVQARQYLSWQSEVALLAAHLRTVRQEGIVAGIDRARKIMQESFSK